MNDDTELVGYRTTDGRIFGVDELEAAEAHQLGLLGEDEDLWTDAVQEVRVAKEHTCEDYFTVVVKDYEALVDQMEWLTCYGA